MGCGFEGRILLHIGKYTSAPKTASVSVAETGERQKGAGLSIFSQEGGMATAGVMTTGGHSIKLKKIPLQMYFTHCSGIFVVSARKPHINILKSF